MKVWTVFLLAVVIFVAGAVTGGMAVRTRMLQQAPAQFPPIPLRPQLRMDFLHRMDRELSLSTNQYLRIENIIRSSHERMQKLLEPIAPEAQAEALKVKREISAELTPEQHKRFEELLKARHGEPSKRHRREERETNTFSDRARPDPAKRSERN